MREIKFRAWNKEENLMISNPYINEAGYLNEDIAQMQDNGLILMQYTGLKDKNGVEIYEEDIVKCSELPNITGKPLYNPDNLVFEVKYNSPYIDPFAQFIVADSEVIGNIHETPELLKEAKDS